MSLCSVKRACLAAAVTAPCLARHAAHRCLPAILWQVNLWIQDIRDTRDKNIEARKGICSSTAGPRQAHGMPCLLTTSAPPRLQVLRKLRGPEQVDKLVELNVMRQVRCCCRLGLASNCLFPVARK